MQWSLSAQRLCVHVCPVWKRYHTDLVLSDLGAYHPHPDLHSVRQGQQHQQCIDKWREVLLRGVIANGERSVLAWDAQPSS
eukprot:1192819-Amphidinium_carterae.1